MLIVEKEVLEVVVYFFLLQEDDDGKCYFCFLLDKFAMGL